MSAAHAEERATDAHEAPDGSPRVAHGAYCRGPLDGPRTQARERQFGLAGAFTYVACSRCESLHLERPPEDLAPYYPREYYSLATTPATGPVRMLHERALHWAVTGRGLSARAAAWIAPPSFGAVHRWLRRAGTRLGDRVLDVGSGRGALLRAMRAAGYRDLTGVDPFLEEDEVVEGLRLLRRSIEDVDDGPYDLVMLHHSLEHVRSPEATLRGVRRVLRDGGHVLVRVPIVPSAAWRRYGAAWVQLDAPRHLTVPSERGLTELASRVSLALEAVEHDSSPVQFWASELYERGITLSEGVARLGYLARRRGMARARRLNAARQGDQAAFLFRGA